MMCFFIWICRFILYKLISLNSINIYLKKNIIYDVLSVNIFSSVMREAWKGTRFRSVGIKVVRCITGRWQVSYLSQGLPQPTSSQTGPSDSSTSITPREAERDDVTHSCSSCTEAAYSKAKRRALNAWDAVMDDMLKVSFKCSAPITTRWLVCREHGDYRCLERSATSFVSVVWRGLTKICCTFLIGGIQEQ